jgi:hypothetical protein
MNKTLALFKHNYASTCMNNNFTKVTNFDHISCCTCNYNTFCLCLVHFMCLKISCWFGSPHFETLASCWTLFKHVRCFHILHTCQQSCRHKMRFKSHPLLDVLFMNIHLPTLSIMTSSTNEFRIPTNAKDLVAHLAITYQPTIEH